MNKLEAPRPRKFSAIQESEHSAHEARIDYVGMHRDQFLMLLFAADTRTLDELCMEIGVCAHHYGQSFDEALYARWRASFHPHEPDRNFKAKQVNFEVYLSALTRNNNYMGDL